METEYIELVLNDRLIRIDKNDSMNLYSWRETKTKPSYWLKLKPTLTIDKKTGYKKYVIGVNRKTFRLSRLVYKAYNNDWDIRDTSDTNCIDHINNNSLDNRIENLRILTSQQNQFNTKAKGCCWDKNKKRWMAQIMINRRNKFLGYFTEKEDAHQAYLNAKEVYHKLPAI